MTSKVSFYRLVKEDVKKRMWLLLVCVVLFMIISPISTLFDINQTEEYYIQYMGISIREHFVLVSGIGETVAFFGVIFAAVLAGITSFAYLHSGKQVDFYHSFPIRRDTWMAIHYASSFLIVMVPYCIGYALRLLVGVVKGIATAKAFQQIPLILVTVLLFFLLIYTVTALAMILTGKILVGVFGIGTLMFYGAGAITLYHYIMEQAYITYVNTGGSFGFVGNLLNNGIAGSPIMLFAAVREGILEGGEPIGKVLLGTLATVLMLMAATFVLFRIRPSEAAGKAIAFKKLEPVVKVMIAVLVGVWLGVVASSQNRMWGMETGWLFGIGILASVLTCMLIEFIYSMDVKMFLKRKTSMVITVLATAGIMAVVGFDLFGYNTFLPKKENLSAMAIDLSVTDGIGELCYVPMGELFDSRMERMKTEEFDALYEMAEVGTKNISKAMEQESYNVTLAYYLKNGKVKMRNYCVDSRMLTEAVRELLEDREYRRNVLGVDEIKAEDVNNLWFYSPLSLKGSVLLPKEQNEKILETYVKEVLTQPASVFEYGNVIGRIEYDEAESEGTEREGAVIGGFPVYKEFTELISLLGQNAEVPSEFAVEEITKLTVLYGKENEKTIEIINREEMQKILECTVLNDYGLKERKLDENAYVRIESQFDAVHVYFNEGEIPEFLKERFEKE